jgi:hypothetical protein
MALSSLDKAQRSSVYPLTRGLTSFSSVSCQYPWGVFQRAAVRIRCDNPWMFKTTTAESPAEYIDMLEEPRRSDIRELDELIRATAPNLEPHLASGMLAYGHYHYKSTSALRARSAISRCT